MGFWWLNVGFIQERDIADEVLRGGYTCSLLEE
jgi:hypothetical protein